MKNLKTVGTALAVLGGCAAARCCLDRSSRRESSYCRGQIRLTALYNENAAFNLPLPKAILPELSGAAIGAVWYFRTRSPIGAGLILGGGTSNLLERLMNGRVYVYIQFPKAPGPLGRFVYNLADLAVLMGSVSLCLFGEVR